MKLNISILILILISILIFFSFSSFAESEKRLYEGYVYSGVPIEDYGYEFDFLVSDSQDFVIFYLPNNDTKSIMKGECDYYSGYRFCYDHANYSYLNKTTDAHIYKAYVRIYVIISDISISNTIEKKELLVGETTKIKTILENIGNKKSENVSYKETLTKELKPKNCKNCYIENNTVIWEGDLNIGGIITLTYDLEAVEPVSYVLDGVINYFNGFEQMNVINSHGLIEVEDYFLKIIQDLSLDDIQVDGTTNYVVSVTNRDNKYIINLKSLFIDVSEGLKIINYTSPISPINNSIIWNAILSTNKTNIFNLTLQAQKTGTYNLSVRSNYLYKGIYKSNDVFSQITISAINPTLDFSYDTSKLIKNGKLSTIVDVINLNDYDIKNISVTLNSEIFNGDPSGFVPLIVPNEKRQVKNEISLINLSNSGNYPVSINVQYNWYDEIFNYNQTYDLFISSNIEEQYLKTYSEKLMSSIKDEFVNVSIFDNNVSEENNLNTKSVSFSSTKTKFLLILIITQTLLIIFIFVLLLKKKN